eukprot:460919_1
MGNQQASNSDPCIIDIPSASASKPNTKRLSHHGKQVSSSRQYLSPMTPTATPTVTSRLSVGKMTPYADSSPVTGTTPSNPTPISHEHPPVFPTTLPLKQQQHKRRNHTKICNGITGTHVSYQITDIAARFWQSTLHNLNKDMQQEIACSILCGTLSSDKQIKQIVIDNMRQRSKTMEYMSLRYLDMIGWLVRHLIKDDVDLYAILAHIGVFHQSMGVQIEHFRSMLDAMHETFAYYFPIKYSIEVKYAMDEIFTICAQIMSGQDLARSPHLKYITQSFAEEDVSFLNDLDHCLQSSVGKQYLFAFLRQTFCDEMVLFLQSIQEFKCKMNAMQMFMVARHIINSSIVSDATLSLNLSFECRDETLKAMQTLEQRFKSKEPIYIDANFFAQVEYEVYVLILNNHWKRFVSNMKTVHGRSFANME